MCVSVFVAVSVEARPSEGAASRNMPSENILHIGIRIAIDEMSV